MRLPLPGRRLLAFLLLAPFHLHAAGPRPVDGWRMELLLAAPALRHPSVVTTAPDGRIFVAEDPMDIRTPRADVAEGRILCLHPDGRLTVYAEDLHAVFGLQYLEGRLFVLHNPRFTVFTDHGDTGGEPVDLIRQTLPEPWALDWNDHIPANFRLGMDGRFHVAVGDKGLFGARGTDGREVNLQGGGVVRIRPDGTELEVFATGLRNILDVALDADDEVFTFDNTDEHDWMGRVSHVIDGGYYGYPHHFAPRRPFVLWCLADVGAGAACGALVYDDDGLPPPFRGNLFLSDFGKRQILRGRLEPSGATHRIIPPQPRTDPAPEVAGIDAFEALFPDPPEDFRPVGICVDADGRSLLVCDWQHRDVKDAGAEVGRLWRLRWEGDVPRVPRPGWWPDAAMGRGFTATDTDLLAGLAHPARSVRMTAQRRLAERAAAGADTRTALAALAGDPGAPDRARIHALWALDRHAPAGLPQRLAADPNPAVARQALRLVGERGLADAWRTATELASGPRAATHAAVRRAAVTALGRLGESDAVPALVGALADGDGHVRHAAFTALRRIGIARPEAWPRIVAHLADPTDAIRDGIGFAVRDVAEVRLVDALLPMARDAALPHGARRVAMERLVELTLLPPEWDGRWWAYHPALQPPPPRTRRWDGTGPIHRALRALAGDPDPTLRAIVAGGLGRVADPTDRPLLRAGLEAETDPGAAIAWVGALAALPDPETARGLAARLLEASTPEPVRRAILRAAPAYRDPALARAALALATDPKASPTLRAAALDATVDPVLPDTVDALGALATGTDPVATTAVETLGRIGGPGVIRWIRSALGHPATAVRLAAVQAAGHLAHPDLMPALLAARSDPAIRTAALSALSRYADPAALDAWLEGLGSPDPVLRGRCREAVAGVREAVLPLLVGRVADLSPVALGELQTVYADRATGDAAPLFADVVPGIELYERHAAAGGGDPARGQRVFFDDTGAACIRCHAVAGHGAAVGPDLTLIGAQFGRAQLIEAVLHPGRTVREGYQAYEVEMRDGSIHLGAIRAGAPGTWTLLGADGRLLTLAESEVVRRESVGASLMPDGLHAGLTLDQFADLIAFLESRREDPRRPGAVPIESGFTPLADGDPAGTWRELPEGTRRVDSAMLLRGRPPEHWTVRDGRLIHDGLAGDLWTAREYGDFELRLEWRWPDPPVFADFPVIDREGREVAGADGRPVLERVLDAGDSGVLLRGLYRAQINLFCYPVGSGESWEYRTDESLPHPVRKALTPSRTMDRPIGDWNELAILLRGDRVTVRLNGEEVIRDALLPGLPERGPVGLQHEHGRIEFRRVRIREIR